MARPGVSVTVMEAPPSRGAPINTGTWFVAGQVATGSPTVATKVTSLTNFEDTFGDRTAAPFLYDALDVAFRNGLSEAYVAGVSGTGNDENDYIGALDLFERGLGPGQVSLPGLSSPAVHAALLDHAENNNRFALLNPTGNDATALAASVAGARARANASYGAVFGPSVVVPGPGGTSRTVTYDAVQAGLEARRDRMYSPGRPAAGRDFPANYVNSFAQTFTEAQRETLFNAGVNVALNRYGVPQTFGYRTVADPTTVPAWWQANHARLRMAIISRLEAVAEGFLFNEIDGRNLLASAFAGALSGELLDLYTRGSLYGATPAEAYKVDVSSAVNTPATIAAGELHASVALRMSPAAEYVVVTISKVPTTESL